MPPQSPKTSFDRDMPRGNPTAGGTNRVVLKPYQVGGPALEPVKDFIALAPSVPTSPNASLPVPMLIRTRPSRHKRATSCTPQPFFIVLSPSIRIRILSRQILARCSLATSPVRAGADIAPTGVYCQVMTVPSI